MKYKYADIKPNDTTNGEGVCVSFWVQGCELRCYNCHNASIWDFSGGKDFTPDTMTKILDNIKANGITRNFSVLGGEPLAPQNLLLTEQVVSTVRKEYPNIKIYLWTGYYYDQLPLNNPAITNILHNIDVLIDGPYVDSLRDITLELRGSSNQRIIRFDRKRKK